jgi:hypothetical protein
MYNLPDLTPLFYLAMFGLLCAILIAGIGTTWLAYHLVMALIGYVS